MLCEVKVASMLEVATSPQSWVDLVQSGGVVGMFVLLTLAVVRRWVVMGWTYDDLEKDRDYYRDLAHQSAGIAERQTTVAEVLSERLALLGDERERRLKAQADILRRRGSRADDD